MGARLSQNNANATQSDKEPRESSEIPVINADATEKRSEVKLPHRYEAILKNADSPIDSSSTEKLYEQLYAGVFLNKKRKKYWVERKSTYNSFMVFARDLSITWAEDNRFWHWPYLPETNNVLIDVAELLNVSWLEIHGKFATTNLSPGVTYEVVFVVMLRDPAYGWQVPVNLRLILPDGSRQEHKENMMEKIRGRWIEIPAGEFTTVPEKDGEMEFSLYDHDGGVWKRGLVIKGVAIRPKA